MTDQRPGPEPPVEPRDEERWRERHYRRRGFPGLVAGLILILLGVLFYLQNQGIVGGDVWWKYFLIGLGIIFLIDAAVRYFQGSLVRGPLIAGVVLTGIGIVLLAGGAAWWPLVLIIVGVAILAGGLFRR